MRPALVILVVCSSLGAGPPPELSRVDSGLKKTGFQINRPIDKDVEAQKKPGPTPPRPRPRPIATQPAQSAESAGNNVLSQHPDLVRVGLFALVSLAPAAVLMLTAFVRINIVLVLLRQALGSPQVPGNQVLTALALLLTALVMRPVGETVYSRSIEPFSQGQITWTEAYSRASHPIKAFMIEQIKHTRHENYVWVIFDEVTPPGRTDPVYPEDFPLGVVATAFLLSELTTALVIGFYLYLPFLVVDLVVSSVLAAMGLFMLPPSLVALPLKLILFVVVNGWLHVATMLLQSFGQVGAAP